MSRTPPGQRLRAVSQSTSTRRLGVRVVALGLGGLAILNWPVPAGYGWFFWTWLVAIGLFLGSFPSSRSRLSAPSTEVIWILCGILLVALGLRLPGLETIPSNIAADEILPGLEGVAIAAGDYHNVFSTLGWFTIPGVSFAFPGVVMKLLPGSHFFALRASSLLTGLAGIVSLFLLLRRLFNDRVALIAVGLEALSFWHIHNSRTGFPFIQTTLFVPLVLYALVRARQDRNLRWMAISGATMGIALQCYFPSRALLLLVPLFLVFGWVGRRDSLRTIVCEGLTFALGLLLVFGPLLHSVDVSDFFGRSQNVLVTRPAVREELERIYRVQGLPAVIWRNLQESASMLTEWADVCILNRSPSGLIDRVTFGALAVGALIAVGQARIEGLLLIAWALLVFVFGVGLTDGPRASYRFAPAFPALLGLAALGFERTLLAQMPRSRWYRATVLPAVLLGIGTWVGLENYQMFFVDYATKGDGRMSPLPSAWRFTGEHCDGRFFYFVSSAEPMGSEPMLDVFCPDHGTIRPENIPRSVDENRPATFIVMGWQRAATDHLRECYPEALVEEHRTPDRRYLFTTVQVDRRSLREGLKNCGQPQAPIELKLPKSTNGPKPTAVTKPTAGARATPSSKPTMPPPTPRA